MEPEKLPVELCARKNSRIPEEQQNLLLRYHYHCVVRRKWGQASNWNSHRSYSVVVADGLEVTPHLYRQATVQRLSGLVSLLLTTASLAVSNLLVAASPSSPPLSCVMVWLTGPSGAGCEVSELDHSTVAGDRKASKDVTESESSGQS